MAAKLLNRKQLSHTGFHFRFYDSREFEHMFTQLWVIWVSRNCPFIPFILAHSSTRFSFLPLFVDFLACLVESRYYSIVGFFFFFLFGDKAKGVHQGCILLPCLFNFYAEYIMWNARLDESQAGIKIARRNMNTLRYAHDTILKAESKEELKSLLMKVKEENEKLALKLNVRRTKIKASGPITS